MGVAPLVKAIRHPNWICFAIRFAWSAAGDDGRLELTRLRQFRAMLRRMGGSESTIARYRAYEAEVLLKCDLIEESRQRFIATLNFAKSRDDKLGRHLKLYAYYWIAMIDNKPGQADHWARHAKRKGVAEMGITRIPQAVECPDKFDKEFERIEAKLAKELKL